MLQCYRTRRRISPYFDGALGYRRSAFVVAHLATCARCRAEFDDLRRLSGMLRHGGPSLASPNWTGFWEGVRRGIEGALVEAAARAQPRWRPRLVAGAAALAVMVSVILWQVPRPPLAPPADAAISVSSADTDHPRGTVMVYSPPEKDLAVVWLFAPDD